MLPEGDLSIGIRADFWQPHKNERKAKLIKYWHQRAVLDRMNIYIYIYIKKVAYNHVTAILQRCQEGPKSVLLLLLCHTFYFHAISQELLEIETINTPLEPLRPADVPFGGFVHIAPHFGGEMPRKPQFWGRE